jgi:hypothetical protein
MYQAHALLSSFPALLCALSHRQTNHCPGRLQNCSLGTATIDPCTDIVLLVIISLSLLYTEHQHLAGKKIYFVKVSWKKIISFTTIMILIPNLI